MNASQETWLLAVAEMGSCVWCGIFKRIKCCSNPLAMPDLFLAGPAIVLFLSPVGHTVVDAHANDCTLFTLLLA